MSARAPTAVVDSDADDEDIAAAAATAALDANALKRAYEWISITDRISAVGIADFLFAAATSLLELADANAKEDCSLFFYAMPYQV